MYRVIKEMDAKGKAVEKVYGVLTDYDLSSWTADLANDYTRTSQQRTGTPPYMAHELLKGTSDVHLYRHDVESLFYVMLMTCARHTIGCPEKGKEPRILMRAGQLPYQKWFNQHDYDTLGNNKYAFLSCMEAIELSRTFEGFRPWLQALQYRFAVGFEAKYAYARQKQWGGGSVDELVAFDQETLGGRLDYSSLIEPARSLEGELEGLIVRYDPKPSQPSTPTGEA